MKLLNFRYTQDLIFGAAPVAVYLFAAVLFTANASANSGYGKELRGENTAVRAQLALLEKVTAPFASYEVAQAAGWNATISDCVESPAGGMGYHVANMAALDGAPFELSLLRPEVLLYAPMADGSMEFVGVEYIVPWTPDNASTPPVMLGQELQYNEEQEIWALHVWIEKHNPAGIFAPFNPEVSCPLQ
ncbi:MAG: hypothetical protein ABJ084_05165 [Halioglobus sp.]